MSTLASTWLISDLHLDPQQPAITAQLFELLQQLRGQASALYILGDLFESWIGDDDDAELAQQVATRLRELADSGTALYFQHGNRDFLLGADYAARCGMQLLPDSCVVELGGVPTLLLHGDTLCIADVRYQQFRQMVRNPAWQAQVLALPLAARRAQAAQLRGASKAHQREQAADIIDADPPFCEQLMAQHGVRQMLHGHTHRPAVHQLAGGRRIVLGDWGPQLSYACFDAQGGRLVFGGQTLQLAELPG